MKFFAIDLETTGLDPKQHSITEFAAVYTDIEGKEPMKMFYRWMNPEGFVWSQYCLDMHSEWLRKVNLRIKAKNLVGDPSICNNMHELILQFEDWVHNELELPLFKGDEKTGRVNERVKYTAAGKNFGSFDSQFLKAASFPDMWRHRPLDPTPLYVKKGDELLPELALCKARAKEWGAAFETVTVAHNAIQDCLDVVDLIRFGYTNRVTLQ
jgi:hypothetical protein